MGELTPTFLSGKGYPTTHFDMDAVEAIGLVKIDILAQGGLAVMRDVKALLTERGVDVDLGRCETRSAERGTRNREDGAWSAERGAQMPDIGCRMPNPLTPALSPSDGERGKRRRTRYIESHAKVGRRDVPSPHPMGRGSGLWRNLGGLGWHFRGIFNQFSISHLIQICFLRLSLQQPD